MANELKIRTALPYERVENFLTACCTKHYSMTLDRVEASKNGPCKVLRIAFEDAADCERFRVTFERSLEPLPSVTAPATRDAKGGRASAL